MPIKLGIEQEVKHQFKFHSDVLSVSEISELMGHGEEVSEFFDTIISDELSLLPTYTDIEGGYFIHKVTLDNDSNLLQIEDSCFNVGKTVGRLIRNSEYVAIFNCTAGKTISERSKLLMDQGLLMEGYVVDLIGSALVERVMDQLQAVLKKQCIDVGLQITNRYSPGYCEWLVNEQQQLFRFFPNNYCGVTLTKNSLMIPSKSISGIIGIGVGVKYTNYTCNLCSSVNCIYRNRKKSTPLNQNTSPCQQ